VNTPSARGTQKEFSIIMTICTRFSRAFFLTLIIVFTGWHTVLVAQGNQRMIFLHCQMEGTKITLLHSRIAKGYAKATGVTQDGLGITYEVRSNNGALLWKDAMSNPIRKRFEYEDPDRPGKLKVKIVDLPQAEFTIRVPLFDDGAEILFFAPGENTVKNEVPSNRKMFARLRLPERSEEK